ncbi:hypothetical protein ACH5RR_025599, partial [Cinchona calisaya]
MGDKRGRVWWRELRGWKRRAKSGFGKNSAVVRAGRKGRGWQVVGEMERIGGSGFGENGKKKKR